MSGGTARVKVRDVELAIHDGGRRTPDAGGRRSDDRPLLLFGHGLLSAVAHEDAAAILDWSPVSAVARVVRYDARSHGDSDLDPDPAHLRWPELAKDMLGLADALGGPCVVLGGLSMGCATALHAAVSAPARVAGLVLVAPPTAWETRARQARFYRIGATVVGIAGLAPFRLLASLRRPGGEGVVAALRDSALDHIARLDARAVVAALRGAAASDLPDPAALRALRIPALVLAWDGDPMHPISTARRLAELLPLARLDVATSLDAVHAWPRQIAGFLRTIGEAAA